MHCVCITTRKIHISKLGSSHSTVGPRQLQGIYRAFTSHLRGVYGAFMGAFMARLWGAFMGCLQGVYGALTGRLRDAYKSFTWYFLELFGTF